MKMKIFSIFDEKSKVYAHPFYFPTRGQAVRAFADLVEDRQGNMINKHPSDFKLYELGEFDDCSGGFVSLPQPDFLAHAIEFVKEGGV